MKKVAAAFLAILFITACKKDNGNGPDTKTGIKLSMTATDTYDFNDIKVGFKSIEYQASTDTGMWWKPFPLADSIINGSINVHTLFHGNNLVLSNVLSSSVHIKNIRIKFASKAFVVKGSNTYPLIVPDDLQQNGIIVPADYAMTDGKIQSIVIVYNTNRSIQSILQNNTFTFNPNIRTFDPAVCGNIEGFAKPDASLPYVTVYTDTIASPNAPSKFNEMTIPYTGGYFKLVGIPVGKYNIKISSTSSDYASLDVFNAAVTKGFTNNIGTFTLKK